MLEDVQHRDDVILAREVDFFDYAVMNWKAAFHRQAFAYVF